MKITPINVKCVKYESSSLFGTSRVVAKWWALLLLHWQCQAGGLDFNSLKSKPSAALRASAPLLFLFVLAAESRVPGLCAALCGSVRLSGFYNGRKTQVQVRT